MGSPPVYFDYVRLAHGIDCWLLNVHWAGRARFMKEIAMAMWYIFCQLYMPPLLWVNSSIVFNSLRYSSIVFNTHQYSWILFNALQYSSVLWNTLARVKRCPLVYHIDEQSTRLLVEQGVQRYAVSYRRLQSPITTNLPDIRSLLQMWKLRALDVDGVPELRNYTQNAIPFVYFQRYSWRAMVDGMVLLFARPIITRVGFWARHF